MFKHLILVRGGGDLGSGVALRLWRAGFTVAVLETHQPVAVRRTVSFGEAVYDGVSHVEEAVGRLVPLASVAEALPGIHVPVAVDPSLTILRSVRPYALVDAIMAKQDTGSRRGMASVVVALGPGFSAGDTVDAVVETNRGPHLGRVIWAGPAQPNTGEPGVVAGIGRSRVLRAPTSGLLHGLRAIGDVVDEGDALAIVGSEPIRSPFRALVRGLARDGIYVEVGMKVGDVDPRVDPTLCTLVSDKSLAVAGGVLEAVLTTLARSKS